MTVTAEQVLAQLRRVKGPDLDGNIVELGLVSEVLIKGDRAYFSITVPAARAGELEPLRQAAEKVVADIAGLKGVTAVLTADAPTGASSRAAGGAKVPESARVQFFGDREILAGWLGLRLVSQPEGIALFWPASGLAAGALMVICLWLHLTEQHGHDHEHQALEHEHSHVHDNHHQHPHNGPVLQPHTHLHRHSPLRHRHAHYPDLHHRHEH